MISVHVITPSGHHSIEHHDGGHSYRILWDTHAYQKGTLSYQELEGKEWLEVDELPREVYKQIIQSALEISMAMSVIAAGVATEL